MRLFLMRHASAGPGDPAGSSDDDDPGLSPDGAAKARAAAHGLGTLGINAALLLTSPLLSNTDSGNCVAGIGNF